MLRTLSVAIAIVGIVSSIASAQYYNNSNYGGNVVSNAYQPNWAAKLIAQPRHNFGVVARGSEQVHIFEFTNPLKNDIVISGSRVSCKCAEPTILTPTVKPGEKGQIKVRFNTLAFLGERHSRITLTVRSPEYTELYLDIDGHVRRDVVVTPGQVDFANLPVGEEASKTLEVKYAGNPNWQILKAECSNPNLDIQLEETRRQGNRIDYRLTVQLKSTQGAGYLNDQIVLHTNDVSQKQFPVAVNGYLKPLIESQSIVDVGQMQQGNSVIKRIVLKSSQDFVITNASTESAQLKIKSSDEKKKLHILEVTVNPQTQGPMADEIMITTDVQQTPIHVRVVGEVMPAIRTNGGQ